MSAVAIATGAASACGSEEDDAKTADSGADDASFDHIPEDGDAGGRLDDSADAASDAQLDAAWDAIPFLCSGDAGKLDPTFGAVVVPVVGTGANSVLALPTGGALVGGYLPGNKRFALARVSADGSLDATFADAGIAETTFVLGSRGVTGLALLADGRVLAAGVAGVSATNVAFAVARYTSTGQLDATFGTAGIAYADFGPFDSNLASIAVLPDGKILLSGTTGDGSSSASTDYAVARFLPTGALDQTFGLDGKVVIDIRLSQDGPGAMAVQSDGRIVVAGGSTREPARLVRDFSAVRLTASGALDPSFGVGGKVVIDGTLDDQYANAAALDASGRIVLAGSGTNAGMSSDMAILRLSASGAVDTSFGVMGLAIADFSGNNDSVAAVVVQPDGKLVAIGGSYPAGGLLSIAVARFHPTGLLDPSFGTGGTMASSVPGFQTVSASSAARAGCLLTIAGTWLTDEPISTSRMGIARYGL